jgi:hypothetical protein
MGKSLVDMYLMIEKRRQQWNSIFTEWKLLLCVMQDMLPILAELRRAVDMQMELDSLVEKENYFQVSHFIDCTLTRIATVFDTGTHQVDGSFKCLSN